MTGPTGRPRAAAEQEWHRILEEVGRGGARLSGLVLTQNRRVLVSVGGRGTTLRLHRDFVGAPAEVLRAIGRLIGGPPRARPAARALVQEYLALRPAEKIPRRRAPRRHRASDRPHLERLRQEFDRVNAQHFDGRLPAVPLYLSRRMSRRNGHFSRDPLEIVISHRLCAAAAPGEAEMTLRHEMIHLWQHVEGVKPGHGADFRRWARKLDVHPRATRPVVWR